MPWPPSISDPNGPRRNHTAKCRARMEQEMSKTEEGRARWEKAKVKMDRWTAEKGEENLKEQETEQQALAMRWLLYFCEIPTKEQMRK